MHHLQGHFPILQTKRDILHMANQREHLAQVASSCSTTWSANPLLIPHTSTYGQEAEASQACSLENLTLAVTDLIWK